MKDRLTFGLALLAGAMMTGCVSYNGQVVDADELVDEANQAFAEQAQKSFEARMKAPPRPVVVTEAPEMAIFLDPSRSLFGGHPLCNSLAVRKEAALAFKAQLRQKVSGIKDFRLVEEQQAMVAVGDEVSSAQNYRLTYNITSLELKENAAGSLTTGLIGAAVGGGAGREVSSQKFWDGVATVEIRLFKPDGATSVFTFTGKGVYNKMVDGYSPLDKTFLVEAVKLAVNDAMEQYALKFGPPTYVTETCQGGQFAKLNVGSRLGVQPNAQVEFYRNVVRSGLNGGEEAARKPVAFGVVGGKGAPVEEDGAWVYVKDFDPASRKVFRWTSARLIQGPAK